MPMSARSSLSKLSPSGRNSGSITLDMNSTVISGTPRQTSMKITENSRTMGMRERRPSASRMPSGSEAAMPVTETTSVTSSPPQFEVSTGTSPKSMSSSSRITSPVNATASQPPTGPQACRPRLRNRLTMVNPAASTITAAST